MSKVSAAEGKGKVDAFGWAARDSSGVLSPFRFTRRANRDTDITIKILYSGICHTDIHFLKNDYGMTIYLLVLGKYGHEIVGEVTKVGDCVTKFRVGDIAGVSALVGSCGSCSDCTQGQENYCSEMVLTYSSRDHYGSISQGGYSDKIVVDQHFAVVIPKALPLDGAAPLLCAGITVYSPMKHYGLAHPGLHLGVVGLGGLGHVAVKFAIAFGMKVTVISTSPGKKKEALARLGANAFLISRDQQQLQEATGTMDGILDTVSGPHSLLPLIDLLKSHGKLILLGAPSTPLESLVMPLLMGGKTIAGSAGEGSIDTQEMIDFAAKHNISADVEVIPMEYVNTALQRLAKNDVKYRFIIDVANTINSSLTN